MRISGLATGMDTEQIIKDMMKAHRLPMDKITQKKQYLEWQLDDYRGVNRQLFDFSQNTFSNMILSTNFQAKSVSVSSTDVSIKGAGSTSDFAGTINVTQLAKSSTAKSATPLAEGVTSSSTLESLGLNGDVPIEINIQALDENGVPQPLKKPLVFNKTDTLQTVLNRINKDSGVNAFFDPKTRQIAVTSKHGGALPVGSKEIEMTGNLAGVLKLEGVEVVKGQEAKFSINGLDMTRSTNNFKLNGFEFTLNEANSKDISFSSTADTEKVFENVVKYVDEYNKLIEDLNKQIREPKYRSFQPLSTEQKSEMKEKEIELWEEKAKSGTLRNDAEITSMLSKMRTALMGALDGQTLRDIGITTSPNYLDNGKLIINEETLKKAISEDPGKVHEMFSKDAGKDAKIGEHGFARQLRMIVDDTQKAIAKRAGKVGDVNDTFTLGKNLNDMNKQIERFEERLRMTEDRLWKQFTAMERAIQRSNAQSASLMNAFGGGM
ncbi:flagellar filament capping protein FliD [Saccharococcus sp. Marseille-Q5394]|uniref:flagellar filament capping protein FliD n=1 Tax=Saccharococcus sp. Marseille-Q5394 TaxID=2972778 RepID=UPI0021C94236|nr:flagellar filament capping protein FliD [Saccharococcus sp. Marseille-Q5394]